MTKMNELTITIPRSHWLRGSSSNGILCTQDAFGSYSLCIMGWIGQTIGISAADMIDIEFLERVRGLGEEGRYEPEAIKLYRRSILQPGDEDDNFSESTPQAALAMTANDDWALFRARARGVLARPPPQLLQHPRPFHGRRGGRRMIAVQTSDILNALKDVLENSKDAGEVLDHPYTEDGPRSRA